MLTGGHCWETEKGIYCCRNRENGHKDIVGIMCKDIGRFQRVIGTQGMVYCCCR